VIAGGRGRRRWSEDEKTRAIEASLEPDAVVSAVARRHGVTPQQLFTWRREARRKAEEDFGPAAGFVPIVVQAKATAASESAPPPNPPPPMGPHSIELDVEASSVFIWPGAEPGMVKAIIGALKAVK
jgi:transposase